MLHPAKQCSDCAKEGAGPKPLTDFNRRGSGYQAICRDHARVKKAAWRQQNTERHRRSVKEWKAKNPEKARKHWRENRQRRIARNPERFREIGRNVFRGKSKFGISRQEYLTLFDSQAGMCAICKVPLKKARCFGNDTEGFAVANIDHCHATGRVRGLLCRQCNISIGIVNDSIEWMESAISYLRT